MYCRISLVRPFTREQGAGWIISRLAVSHPHNASLDFCATGPGHGRSAQRRRRKRAHTEADIVAISFQTFFCGARTSALCGDPQGCSGHSVDEIASIADARRQPPKSALQRGRVALRRLAQAPEDTRCADVRFGRRKITAMSICFQSAISTRSAPAPPMT